MTAAEAQIHLETVAKSLETAIARFVKRPSGVSQLQNELREPAQTMKSVYRNAASLHHAPGLVSALGSIRAHIAQVQLLLDTAATFYCGTISAAVSQSGAYTPDGDTPLRAEHGYLNLKA